MNRQFFILLALFFWLSAFAGTCAVGRFLLYGFEGDAMCRVINPGPKTVALLVGPDQELYRVPAGGWLDIPAKYQLFARNESYIPITAFVEGDPSIRSAMMTWNFRHDGHYLWTGGYAYSSTQGRFVHATVELATLDPKAKENQLRFRVSNS